MLFIPRTRNRYGQKTDNPIVAYFTWILPYGSCDTHRAMISLCPEIAIVIHTNRFMSVQKCHLAVDAKVE
jgi:hypothetical protein